MKTITYCISILNHVLKIPVLLLLIGFSQCGTSGMSEYIPDKAAGKNGSFEVTRSGLPVNWIIYTPKTVPTGDFDLIIDTLEFKEGKQSLKFLVRNCSPDGGWHSPGFCMQYEADPGEIYSVSFWVKNEASEFTARIGGVSATKGQYETIIKSKDTISDWQLFEYKYTIPELMNSIRFEMNILQAGSFWIDDLKIEKI
jgi:hypothetical protein